MKGEDMITPIRVLTIEQICERKEDLIVSADDIKEVARNVRNKAIDEFAERMKDICKTHSVGEDKYTNEPIYAHEDGTWHSLIDEIAEQMKEGGAV